jgi:hypothetical protein
MSARTCHRHAADTPGFDDLQTWLCAVFDADRVQASFIDREIGCHENFPVFC